MAKIVYVYESNNDSLDFLGRFFKTKKAYDVSYFTRLADIKKAIRKDAPDAIIAGAPDHLAKVAKSSFGIPLIAILAKDMPKGMRSIIDHNIENYLISPYQEFDMECKLHLATRKTNYMDALLQDKEDLQTIADFADLLSSTLDPKKVLYMIVRKISQIIPVSRCSILSVDFKSSKSAEVVSSFENQHFHNLTLDLDNYPEIRKALKTRNAVVVTDAERDPLMKPVRNAIAKLGIKSILVIPVIFRSEVIGTLFLRTSRKSYEFNDREIGLCKRIASTAAKALSNAFLFQEVNARRTELEKLAITDYLTGIYNIRYLYHRLESEFASASRYSSPLSCIMMDIDHFKKVNDTYGHRVGDLVLREFASIVKGQIRKSDVFARYGGEEFILILPHTKQEGALLECRRIGKTISEHKFKGLKPKARITASFGVASFPHKKVKTQDDLITFADDALLQAKQEGRNRSVAFG